MNFFEHQDRARRQSRRLIILFVLAIVGIVFAVDAALLVVLGSRSVPEGASLLSAEAFKANGSLLAGGALATALAIGLASLGRTASLRSGGGRVAQELGGTLVDANSRDPLLRRLVNVVEEIALAAGVPVPEIYVLEKEDGINAFAAGFSPADAAVAVTRGTLENLDRNELQGVIAHEFSHILNGDMRLNIRLMGALFGILVLSIIARRVMHGSLYVGRSREGGGAVMVIAVAVMLIGYIGQFFGRWIKAAVSRQREYLADASAVQFTRDPSGISGALKKIAVYSNGSHLQADNEEINHMLFGEGSAMQFFATHPPILDRIGRVEPGFVEDDLRVVAERIQRDQRREAEREAAHLANGGGGSTQTNVNDWIRNIGNPQGPELLAAAALAASIPDPLIQAAHSTRWAPAVLVWTLLDADAQVRDGQLAAISNELGPEIAEKLESLQAFQGLASPEQRLPLFEIAYPQLKRRPADDVVSILKTVGLLIEADGKLDVFEYMLGRLMTRSLWESANPGAASLSGRARLRSLRAEVAVCLETLAVHGHAEGEEARAAFESGWATLEVGPAPESGVVLGGEGWASNLDEALKRLDGLRSADKESLIRAALTVVFYDDRPEMVELELLRVISGMIHVPMPVVAGTA